MAVVSHADVEDNHAIGETIFYGLSTVVGANVAGWVFSPSVPGLAAPGLAALAALLGASAWRVRRRRASQKQSA